MRQRALMIKSCDPASPSVDVTLLLTLPIFIPQMATPPFLFFLAPLVYSSGRHLKEATVGWCCLYEFTPPFPPHVPTPHPSALVQLTHDTPGSERSDITGAYYMAHNCN